MRQLDKAKVPGPHEVTRDDAKAFLKDAALRLTQSSGTVYIAAATLVLTDLFGDDEERSRMFHGHKLRYLKKAKQRAALTRDDLRALIATGKVKQPLSVFLRILLGTGARREEAHSGVYDLARRVLVVGPEIAKNASSVRDIPLSEHVLPAARAWVTLKAAKRAPHIDTLAENFVEVRALAEVPVNKTLHSCRHSFATELARMGVPKDRRMMLTGHSGGDVHSGYVHLGPEDLRADVEKVDFETGIEWP
jgi:integrase